MIQEHRFVVDNCETYAIEERFKRDSVKYRMEAYVRPCVKVSPKHTCGETCIRDAKWATAFYVLDSAQIPASPIQYA